MTRIIFMGSPEEVVAPLRQLYELAAAVGDSRNSVPIACSARGIELVAVVSQPARPAGRGGRIEDPPVATFAKASQIKCLQPERARSEEFLAEFAALEPDIVITAAYGQILSDAFLAIPKIATINIHPSRLPAYRGATPIPAALLDGMTSTAISILFTVKKLDAGNIILQKDFPIESTETSGQLTSRLFAASGDMLIEALKILIADHQFKGTPQDESQVTLCKKIDKEMGAIDWALDAAVIENRFRAFEPWPGSWTMFAERRVAITEMRRVSHSTSRGTPGRFSFDKPSRSLVVQCGEGSVAISRLKPAGGKDMDAASFWNGLKEKTDVTFSSLSTQSQASL
jgi:methionyl-tRNA formyltransferase